MAAPRGPHPGLGEHCASWGGLGKDIGLGLGPALGALVPLRGPGDGHGGAQRCLRPLRMLLCCCVAPHLICSGTPGSDKSPRRHSGEMLWLLQGAGGAPSWVGGGSEPARCGHAALWERDRGSQDPCLLSSAPVSLPLDKLPVQTAASLPKILLRLGSGLRGWHEGQIRPFPSCSSGRSVGPAAHAALCPGSARLWG